MTDQSEPATITDPAWLQQQYAAVIRRWWDTDDGGADEIAAAVLAVRDRHLEQLRQRLALADATLNADAVEQLRLVDAMRQQNLDAAAAAIQRAEQAEAKVLDYENRITWHTTCESCARILDSSIRETERAERAEAELAALTQRLDIGDAQAWCKYCRRTWNSPAHRCESDAEQRLQKIAELRDRWLMAGPPPLGTPVARWVDRRLVELNTALDQPKDAAP